MARRPSGRSDLQEALQRLGARRVEAALVASLAEAGPLGTRDIVERTGLRQPEVSVGMRLLREREWVETEAVARSGKGRPMHRYKLVAPPASVRRHYEVQGQRSVASLEGAVQLLKRRLG
ncbi:MAG TPA: ArsR family transcriptional regulator [Candidatus Thermoplasmatota archaeon]|nr:ArsR family transcriptional regulator [Candidatus Thermoplasmatota archaeon]